MKDDNKLIQEALIKCLASQIAIAPNKSNSADERVVEVSTYMLKCASAIREVMQNTSLVVLSTDKLNEIKSDIAEFSDKVTRLKNQIKPVNSDSLKINKKLIKMLERWYARQVRDDTENTIRDLMKSMHGNDVAQDKIRFMSFKAESKNKDRFEYKYYLKKVFEYQYKFAQRSQKIVVDQLIKYCVLCNDECIEIIVDGILSIETMPYTFHFNPLKPLEMSLQEIENFKDDMVILMEFNANYYKTKESIAAIIDFPKDSDGRFKHRNDLEELFNTWERYLEAYDYSEKGLEPEEIYSKLNLKTNVDDRKKAVKSYIDYAKRYIRAVENGTFPHIE